MIRTSTRQLTGLPAVLAMWVVVLLGIPEYRQWLPPSNWFVVDQVRVISTFVGEDPTMLVDRRLTMKRPTLGRYAAKVTHNGATVCTATDTTTYTPKANLPPRDTFKLFGWWFGLKEGETPAKHCRRWPLPPGEYCLETLWKFFPDGYPTKTVSHEPACFLFVKRQERFRQ